jgi:BlaI family transcriptional regulator, penicillinase repressor
MNIVSKQGSEGPILGDREIEIMRALWVAGSGTVAEVRRKLAAELAYTTVLTILRNLESKGYVSHEEEGRVHRYSPLLGRSQATKAAICRIVDSFFEGSTEQLVRYLAQQKMVSRKDLKRIRRELAKGKVKVEIPAPKKAKKKKARPVAAETETSEAATEASEPVNSDGGSVEHPADLANGQIVSDVVLDSENPGEAARPPAVDDTVEHA